MGTKLVEKLTVALMVSFIAASFSGCSLTKYSSKQEQNLKKDNKEPSKETVSNTVVKEVEKKQFVKGRVLPGSLEGMNDENYWIDKLKESKSVIMTNDQIEKFNSEIIKKVSVVYDLHNYKDSVGKNELTGYVNFYAIPKKAMYDSKGAAINDNFYNKVKANCNLAAIKENSPIAFGVVVRKTNLRTFPTEEGVYDSSTAREIDRFQESSAEACEPVIILYSSLDKKWSFIQMYNYRAWVKSEDIAIAKDKKEFLDFLDIKSFLVVTGNHVRTQFNPYNKDISQVEFGMGTRVPLVENAPEYINNHSSAGNYTVKLPCRDDKGMLQFKNALLSMKEDVNIGFLPYTRENIIKEAFKQLGDRYDWGNKYSGRDCSGFIASVYNTFGIKLPRNTDEQEKGAGTTYKFSSGDSLEKRNVTLDKVKPGAVIFMKGHEMMYLGKVDGQHFMIHDFVGYGKKESTTYTFVPVYEVAVTSTEIQLSSGQPFIKNFTSVLQLE